VGAVLGAVRTVGEGHAEGTRPAAAGPGLGALFFARQRRGCCSVAVYLPKDAAAVWISRFRVF